MKIIKSGIKKGNQVWRGECHNCKAVIEAERKELKVESCMREGYEFAHLKCPECSSVHSLILYPVK